MSGANIKFIKIIQQFAAFSGLLDELRQGWQIKSLVHGDIKADNCMVFAREGSQRKTRLKIVDWEGAIIGDPCWDVGSIFNDYLSFWLLSIPITGEIPSAQFLELARYPLERMQPALRSFWQAYVRQMELDHTISIQWLLRAVRYGAARLLQTAYEHMQNSMQLTGNAVCLSQLSLNILQQPQAAIVHLLGIPLKDIR